MKAHIRTEIPEKMLIYGTDDKTGKLEEICLKSGVQPVKLGDNALTEKVGTLAMQETDIFSGSADDNIAAPQDNSLKDNAPKECVIFCGIGEKKLDHILKAIRQNIPGGIPLKAVLTAANSKMTLEELLRELQREHERLEKR